MKLYVWNEPYPVDWGGSCAYVIAESEDEARSLLAHKARLAAYGSPPSEGYQGSDRLPPEYLGAPHRVHDLPYAEIYEWSE